MEAGREPSAALREEVEAQVEGAFEGSMDGCGASIRYRGASRGGT